MSLPWSKVLNLRVEPGLVRGVLKAGRIQAMLRARTSCTKAAATPTDTSIDAQAQAIEAVLLKIAETAPLRGARLEVELADSLVHLDVVAGDFAGDSDRQLQSVAAACVSELLGDAAQNHEVRWQLQADGKHLLIGAIALDRLTSLAQVAARHGLALGSVQPNFCLQWNRHAAALKPGTAVFAVASGRQAVIASVFDGAITAIGSGAWLDRLDVAGALDIRTDRLLASIGLDAARQSAYVLVAPEATGVAASARWTVLNRRTPRP